MSDSFYLPCYQYTEEDVARATHGSRFSMARMIKSSQKVGPAVPTFSGMSWVVTGDTNDYSVRARRGELLDASCSCADYSKYAGRLCKHGAAVLLSLLDSEPLPGLLPEPEPDSLGAGGASLVGSPAAPDSAGTGAASSVAPPTPAATSRVRTRALAALRAPQAKRIEELQGVVTRQEAEFVRVT